MVRRALLPALLAALLIGGCGSAEEADLTPAQREARIAFLEAHEDFSDRELARLCPGLYPRDFLTDEDEYPVPRGEGDRDHPKVTAEDRRQAAAAGCDVRP